MKRLTDRVAVVTGAGSGIGRATSEALAAPGCHLALVDVSEQADEAHIVNMSSMVGLFGLAQNASYSLTKDAVQSFSESLRNELAAAKIGVTTVFPGAINTNITAGARGAHATRLAWSSVASGRARLAARLTERL